MMEETSSVPMKRAQMMCIIHCSSEDSSDDSNLVSPQNLESWQTLLKAAQIRQTPQFWTLPKAWVSERSPQFNTIGNVVAFSP